ncbi:MAG: hypothetical protein ACE5GF_03675 [Thermodesulfobacteriota bacterium]
MVRGRLNHEVHERYGEGRRRKGIIYYPQISQIRAVNILKSTAIIPIDQSMKLIELSCVYCEIIIV